MKKSKIYNSMSAYAKDMAFAYLLVIEGIIFSYCVTVQEQVWTDFMVLVVVFTLRYFRKYIRKIKR